MRSHNKRGGLWRETAPVLNRFLGFQRSRITAVIASEFDGDHEGEFVTGAGGDVPTNPECGIVGEALEQLVASTGYTINKTRLTFIGLEGETMSLRAIAAP